MGLTEILYGITPAEIGSITLDASVRETHRARAEVTRHPIEAEPGWQQTVTDNIRVEPLSITIEGVVSNTPAEFLAAIVNVGLDPAHDAFQEWLDNLLTGKILTVITTLIEYPYMVLESLEVPRDKDRGDSLFFTASLTQVNFAELLIVPTLPATLGVTVAGGKQKTVEAAAASVDKTSAFKALFSSLWGG